MTRTPPDASGPDASTRSRRRLLATFAAAVAPAMLLGCGRKGPLHEPDGARDDGAAASDGKRRRGQQ